MLYSSDSSICNLSQYVPKSKIFKEIIDDHIHSGFQEQSHSSFHITAETYRDSTLQSH
jgi:hypothetical protein